MAIFDFYPIKWSAYKEDVKEWTMKNWHEWSKTKPAWFTDVLIARVPDEFIPKVEVERLDAAAPGGQRRRTRRNSIAR